VIPGSALSALEAALTDILRPLIRAELEGALASLAPQVVAAVAASATPATPARNSLLTVEDIARFCQVTAPTVRGWIRDGQLPAVQLGDVNRRCTLRVKREVFDDFIERRRATAEGHADLDTMADLVLNGRQRRAKQNRSR